MKQTIKMPKITPDMALRMSRGEIIKVCPTPPKGMSWKPMHGLGYFAITLDKINKPFSIN